MIEHQLKKDPWIGSLASENEKHPQDGACVSKSERSTLVGHAVLFCPPQDCKNKCTPDFYAATITKVNGKSAEHGQVETVDLCTMGPNSIYFQHNVPHSSRLMPGCWSFRN